MPFLRARWLDLLLVTWQVPDELLLPLLPSGLTLDRWEGRALASLVAFDFRDTRVLGVPWPGFINFPELNLRFYVRDGERRGVCFVREYVPSRVVSWVARTLYNEPYAGVPYLRDERGHRLTVGGRSHTIAWTHAGEPATPPPASLAHFLKEHEWGFGRRRDGRPLVYRVEHPVWRCWPEVTTAIDVDYGLLYGPAWTFLTQATPLSVVNAEGSAITVGRATART